jgi:hypothetical protein
MLSFLCYYANMNQEEKTLLTDSKKIIEYSKQHKPEMTDIEIKDNNNTLTLFVSKDYLLVNGIRVSLFPKTAQTIADYYDCILPTPKLVDIIWEKSDIQLEPRSMSSNRGSVDTLIYHNSFIEQAILGRSFNLIAGHKKDIVISAKAWSKGKVTIYGWHKLNGKPIQPLSSIHSESYKDYSHGTRLISRKCILNGVGMDIWDVLNGDSHGLISNEGKVSIRGYR